ncbi:hypothetical protein Poli38472_014457 [Pythium oligandrum]|uniref:Uncharacterized protein n=2 Tax=Pythiaceae TaxID=4782 RepID=A0A8K1CCT5_PYTOL|nr:hypothetical protein Poli38472_014457 [Pythium oligandrum]DBA02571.1 TPA: hypothetical protein N0F65_011943 [Lagenidium giganteum]|eukprot:TMW60996.1 hypothetical protein Poli38472_014457 [Pythium oligandrum]
MMQWVSIPASRVLLFTFISYAVKIVFQEYIKHQVLQQKMRKGWKSPREPSNLSWPCEARNKTMAEHEKWKTRVLRYHVAEIAADMHAEYIAIGCCYATLFFYWSRPKYELGRWLNGGIKTNATYSTNLEMLPLQIGSELLVDYISCF